jgi:hypothetical protein
MKKKKTIIIGSVVVIVLSAVAYGIFNIYAYIKEDLKWAPARQGRAAPGEKEANIAFATATSTWLTYRNEKHGFEFRYPSGVKMTESELHDQYNDKIITPMIEVGAVGIVVNTVADSEFWDREMDMATSAPITIDEVVGKRDLYWFVGERQVEVIFPLNNGYNLGLGTSDVHKQDLEKILSTLKFLRK